MLIAIEVSVPSELFGMSHDIVLLTFILSFLHP